MISHRLNIKKDAVGSTDLALLGFIRRGPIHGYEIYHLLTHTPELKMIWQIKQSRLYAMLERLESDGYLSVTLVPQEGRPPRKMLTLSPAGMEAYRAWLATPVAQPRDMRLAFMLKLYFAQQDGPPAARQLLEAQQARCRTWLARQAAAAPAGASHQSLIDWVQTFRVGQIRAMMDWLEQILEDLNEA